MSVGQIFNFHCLIVALLQLNFYAFEIVLYVMFLKLTISSCNYGFGDNCFRCLD